jgi:hypothetical protein
LFRPVSNEELEKGISPWETPECFNAARPSDH